MATKTLPETYCLAEKIALTKNKRLAVGMNLATLPILVLFIVGFIAMYAPKAGQSHVFTIQFFPLVLCILGIVIIIIVHELVHGIFIKCFAKAKVQYAFHGVAASAGSPDYYFSKKEYTIIALAPFVIINSILAIVMPFLHGAAFMVVYCVLAFHVTGCVGDIYVMLKLFKYQSDTLIRDSGPEMEFYVPAEIKGAV